jgi:hypothetical protein
MGVWNHELTDLSHAGSQTPYLKEHVYHIGLLWILPCVPSLAPCQNLANKMPLLLLLKLEGFWDLTASLHAGGKQLTLPLLTCNSCLILRLLPRHP